MRPDVAHHDWFIEEREIDRHVSRRGRQHAYEQIDPRTTALVVVDVVRFFVEASAHVRGIVPNINRLATTLRSAGGTVTWVVPRTTPPTPRAREFYGDHVAELYRLGRGRLTAPTTLARTRRRPRRRRHRQARAERLLPRHL